MPEFLSTFYPAHYPANRDQENALYQAYLDAVADDPQFNGDYPTPDDYFAAAALPDLPVSMSKQPCLHCHKACKRPCADLDLWVEQ